jgi:hypothetical protein
MKGLCSAVHSDNPEAEAVGGDNSPTDANHQQHDEPVTPEATTARKDDLLHAPDNALPETAVAGAELVGATTIDDAHRVDEKSDPEIATGGTDWAVPSVPALQGLPQWSQTEEQWKHVLACGALADRHGKVRDQMIKTVLAGITLAGRHNRDEDVIDRALKIRNEPFITNVPFAKAVIAALPYLHWS